MKQMGVINEYTSHIRNYDYQVVCGAVGTEFPTEYEIPRENTGTLKDQGYVGACVAEVIAQVAESFYQEEMSEGFVYGNYRKHNGYGLYVTQAMDFWVSLGTLPKKYFDILKEMPEMKKIVDKFPDFKEKAEKYKLKGYVSINYADKTKKDNSIKDALNKYGYGLLAVSDDYFGESHCIMLTGWNDNTDSYKIKNSWGVDYGNNGFSEIPKKEISAVYLPIFEQITLPFEDVSENDWFYNDVKAMYFSGMVKGTSDKTFEPNKPMTRAEVTALMNRQAKATDERFDIFNRVLNEKLNRS